MKKKKLIFDKPVQILSLNHSASDKKNLNQQFLQEESLVVAVPWQF